MAARATKICGMPFSSPSPSGEGDSSAGSPDTRLTAPSPGEPIERNVGSLRHQGSILDEPQNEKQVVHFSQGERRAREKDPFVTPGRASKSGLSPTASAFNPFHIATDFFEEMRVPVNMLSHTMGLSRWLKIIAEQAITPQQVNLWLQDLEKVSRVSHGEKRILERKGIVGVFFEDIRDAWNFQSQTSSSTLGWQVVHDSSAELYPLPRDSGQLVVLATVPAGSAASAEEVAAEVMTNLRVHGEIFAFQKKMTYRDGSFRGIVEYCDVLAAKMALAQAPTSEGQSGVRIVLATYMEEDSNSSGNGLRIYDTPRASNPGASWEYGLADSKQNLIPQANLCLNTPLAMYPVIAQPNYTPNFPYLVNSFIASGPGAEVATLSTPISPTYQRVSAAYRKPPSPALTIHNGFSPSRSNSDLGKLDRRQHAARVNRNAFQSPSSHHNHVDVHRIREGIDVRTTIMLRNIPNKVDQAMLKRIVDESSWGKYDFMYLRIDFANDCNVGYAFINFVDPLDIIDFVEARGNQRWNCFKSDKVAEVSYATIQGKDCLVQKFRNSSVMLEAAHYRPKLYFTSNGPMPEMAGQEEQFPEPDNQSKMKRSCENAEHVGLFTPNAGQHFRDEQRRRRSQYDRGTRLAALEEYDLEAIQHLYIGNERGE
ncbi:meiosis protein MEI2 [Cordyceps militaris CM01]|uniref:Meiosis protein MEI2 n=1 Tax=Cordyceps militaris (strain CM01) TaxID=983644 RepID=G3JHA1_CORMM|nr:meiosis protein MEI2 [Cordyceps militaris CM01]EGX91657.1 meiosis protein MEI2 [Cordyceps militaris CM01]